MYLTGKRYIWPHESTDVELAAAIGRLLPDATGKRIKEVSVEAGYWRKANAIHAWFVENVQNGDDDCREYEVSDEQLQELLAIVEQVLADHSKANVLLPTQKGCFFGGETYDDWYFSQLTATMDILKGALTLGGSWDLYYRASW